jgi:hypothetical protein
VLKQDMAIMESGAIGLGSDTSGYEAVRPTHRLTRRECYGALERRELPRALIARFHAKYKRVDSGCWEWQAGTFKKGYGMVNLGRFADGRQHTEYAHRVAYVLAKGSITQGSVVMHACDNTSCVNPEHLNLGTQGDNIRDCYGKGRMPKTRNRRKAA